jgi:RNA-directed DNA polymerase
MQAKENYAYFRFVDDVLLLMPTDDSKVVIPEVARLIGMAGLEVHPIAAGEGKSAVGHVHDAFEYLGYKFEQSRVTVRSGSVSRIESRLSRAFTAHKYALKRAGADTRKRSIADSRLKWHVDLVITGCRFEGKSLGWLAYFSQIRHQQLLRHLDDLVGSKRRRYATEHISFKSFVTAYRLVATRRVDATGYIPNFDAFDVAQMKDVLISVFGISALYLADDESITRLFSGKIRKEVKDLEHDVEGAAY